MFANDKLRGERMARDLNKVQLTGRLGADPAMRYTAQGSAIATFRVASNRTWRSSAGVSHEDTEWFRVVAWDQLAEQCRTQLGRGDHIYVEGRLQTRQWVEADGQQRLMTEVVASEVIVLGAAGSPERPPPAEANGRGRRSARVRPAPPPPDLAGDGGQPAISLSEEDLPI
jgi:single-strand DNA-binding protein